MWNKHETPKPDLQYSYSTLYVTDIFVYLLMSFYLIVLSSASSLNEYAVYVVE